MYFTSTVWPLSLVKKCWCLGYFEGLTPAEDIMRIHVSSRCMRHKSWTELMGQTVFEETSCLREVYLGAKKSLSNILGIPSVEWTALPSSCTPASPNVLLARQIRNSQRRRSRSTLCKPTTPRWHHISLSANELLTRTLMDPILQMNYTVPSLASRYVGQILQTNQYICYPAFRISNIL